MKRMNRERRDKMNKIFIFGSIVIIAFLVSLGINLIISGFSGTGYSVFQPEDAGVLQGSQEGETSSTVSSVTSSCSDSDNGLNYDMKGSVEYCDSAGCYNKEDFCLNGKLNEWYCEDANKVILKSFSCQSGYVCQDGFCKEGGISEGGSSSSSSDNSGNVVSQEASEVLELGDLSFSRFELAKNEQARFSVLDISYMIQLVEFEPTRAIVSVGGDSQTIELGQEIMVDLNGNGVSDVSVRLDSVNIITNKVKLSLTRIV